ncbi:beta-lactamase family protein [Microbacterium sp. Sa4CUA7]|uniref:Beta-lactamase family protein n=1 Tax=Microbacterium pullorum TaxID=2762236 RepID=A0ABR8RZ39_9MICO|nr:serine hydrolase domain-containing protein [Microbacterium pullorum]MBD7956497.1 beta-lactamase family protein [Microbacterium pullorum]
MGDALSGFVDRALDADIALHTLQVSVDGELAVTDGIAPFHVDEPHRLYSVSKSITGLAVLLLADEGALTLDDPVVDHFPEMPPVHPWLAETRIDDMLAMTGPHSRTTYDAEGDGWLESYFRVPPTHRPGTFFTYDTSASYVLAALVERLSGGTVLDYLRPRVLEPLGVGAGARFLTGPEGYSHGGSGLMAAPADLLPLAEVINGGGVRGGSRIVPEAVVRRLIERRSDPGMQTWGAPLRAGYGRQVWLPGGGAWLMFGLGGQLVYGDPAKKVAAVVTADATALASGDQRLVDLLCEALGAETPAPGAVLRAPTRAHDAAYARTRRGRYEVLTGEDAPTQLHVDLAADTGQVRIGGEHVPYSVTAPVVAELGLGRAVVTAGWSAPGVLELRVSAAADDIASVRMRIVTHADDLISVMSQGFGPAIGPAWTWRGTYRAAAAASAP